MAAGPACTHAGCGAYITAEPEGPHLLCCSTPDLQQGCCKRRPGMGHCPASVHCGLKGLAPLCALRAVRAAGTTACLMSCRACSGAQRSCRQSCRWATRAPGWLNGRSRFQIDGQQRGRAACQKGWRAVRMGKGRWAGDALPGSLVRVSNALAFPPPDVAVSRPEPATLREMRQYSVGREAERRCTARFRLLHYAAWGRHCWHAVPSKTECCFVLPLRARGCRRTLSGRRITRSACRQLRRSWRQVPAWSAPAS